MLNQLKCLKWIRTVRKYRSNTTFIKTVVSKMETNSNALYTKTIVIYDIALINSPSYLFLMLSSRRRFPMRFTQPLSAILTPVNYIYVVFLSDAGLWNLWLKIQTPHRNASALWLAETKQGNNILRADRLADVMGTLPAHWLDEIEASWLTSLTGCNDEWNERPCWIQNL